mgnify:CR=1 FL=1
MLFKFVFILTLTLNLVFAQDIDTTVQKSPRKAFIYSFFPSGGQIYNGKWFKALIVIGLEIASVQQWSRYRNAHNDWNDQSSLTKHQYLEKRNKYAWWIWFIYMFGMLEAVVDAHLYPFDNIMEADIKNSNQGGQEKNE